MTKKRSSNCLHSENNKLLANSEIATRTTDNTIPDSEDQCDEQTEEMLLMKKCINLTSKLLSVLDKRDCRSEIDIFHFLEIHEYN